MKNNIVSDLVIKIVLQLLQKVNVNRKVNVTKMITFILKLSLQNGKRSLYSTNYHETLTWTHYVISYILNVAVQLRI